MKEKKISLTIVDGKVFSSELGDITREDLALAVYVLFDQLDEKDKIKVHTKLKNLLMNEKYDMADSALILGDI